LVVTVGRLVLPGGTAEARTFQAAMRAALTQPRGAPPERIAALPADAQRPNAAQAGAAAGAAVAATLAGRRR
jgi:hypothetical protein